MILLVVTNIYSFPTVYQYSISKMFCCSIPEAMKIQSAYQAHIDIHLTTLSEDKGAIYSCTYCATAVTQDSKVSEL